MIPSGPNRPQSKGLIVLTMVTIMVRRKVRKQEYQTFRTLSMMLISWSQTSILWRKLWAKVVWRWLINSTALRVTRHRLEPKCLQNRKINTMERISSNVLSSGAYFQPIIKRFLAEKLLNALINLIKRPSLSLMILDHLGKVLLLERHRKVFIKPILKSKAL